MQCAHHTTADKRGERSCEKHGKPAPECSCHTCMHACMPNTAKPPTESSCRSTATSDGVLMSKKEQATPHAHFQVQCIFHLRCQKSRHSWSIRAPHPHMTATAARDSARRAKRANFWQLDSNAFLKLDQWGHDDKQCAVADRDATEDASLTMSRPDLVVQMPQNQLSTPEPTQGAHLDEGGGRK